MSEEIVKHEFDSYQGFTSVTAMYPKEYGLIYTTLGLAGEAGEVANKVKKIIRDANGEINEETRQALKSELGDVYWYLARLADELGFKSSEVIAENVKKLSSRFERGVITGNGDNR